MLFAFHDGRLHRYRVFIDQEVLDLAAEEDYCTTPSVVAIPGVVEIIMASEPAMCKTKHHKAETYTPVQKLVILLMTEAAYVRDCGFPGSHVVIPAPDNAEYHAYGGQVVERRAA